MTKENLVVFKENSYVDDIKDIMMKERIRDFPVVTEDDCYAGMISRRNLIDMNKKKFILVDHNEADQPSMALKRLKLWRSSITINLERLRRLTGEMYETNQLVMHSNNLFTDVY